MNVLHVIIFCWSECTGKPLGVDGGDGIQLMAPKKCRSCEGTKALMIVDILHIIATLRNLSSNYYEEYAGSQEPDPNRDPRVRRSSDRDPVALTLNLETRAYSWRANLKENRKNKERE